MATTIKLAILAYLLQISGHTYGIPVDGINLLGEDDYPEVDDPTADYDPSLIPVDYEPDPSLLAPDDLQLSTLPDPEYPVFPEGEAIPGFQYTGDDFEGDILSDPMEAITRAGSYNTRWYNGVVKYWIDGGIDRNGRNAIFNAMRHIQDKTCIEFEEDYRYDYVYIKYGHGCSSFVGRKGGAQELNLGRGCWDKGTIVHELVHAIGFWHEQSRPDRDSWVNIHWSNIGNNHRREFDTRNSDYFGTDYDYRSIMHYRFNAFSYSGPSYATITPKQYGVAWDELGAGDGYGGLTNTDATQINRMYNCR